MAVSDGQTISLRAKYQAERDKRVRTDATAQYRTLDEVFTNLERDPYTPIKEREPIFEEMDVAIIGAGLGGLQAAGHMVELGITDFRIVDKAGDFGGTWYWNRYPGAACDIESYVYLPFLEETGYVPIEKYSKAPEIFAHCQRIGRHFDLYPKALFQSEVSDLSWDEDASRWRLKTDRGDILSPRFVIVAGGILHKAKLPGIPGIEYFKGDSFHSSRWDYAITGGSPSKPMDKLRDKRVALIGTGATAVQIVPRVAEAAGALTVFQRTPSGVGVRANRPTDSAWAESLQSGWHRERVENFTSIVSGKAADQDLVGDGWTEIFRRNPGAMSVMNEDQQRIDDESMDAIRARIDSIIVDSATAEALKPWYSQLCKRPCFHDDYLPAFNRPNVKLVDTAGKGVERITENAVVVDGVEYPVDLIIYASGFEVGSAPKRQLGFEIHGRGGVSLTDAWVEGPATLHGMHARGFPNLVMFSMTQGGIAINFAHILNELAQHAAWFLRRCLDEGVKEIEPTAEAQDAWFQVLMGNLGSQAMFYASCTPSYMNGEGQTTASMAVLRHIPFFGGTMEYVDTLRQWRNEDAFGGLEFLTRQTGSDGPQGSSSARNDEKVAPRGAVATSLTDLTGRVVLVTGGADGIGAGIAEALGGAGASVVVADINGDGAERKAAALRDLGYSAQAVQMDVSDEAAVVGACRWLIAEFGAPWALVNNAGVQDRELLLEAQSSEWDRVHAVNSRGPFLLMREIARAMVEAKRGGRIVNVASAALNGQIIRGHTAYAASKASLLGLMLTSAFELAEHAITVNTLLPGGVMTTGAISSKGPPMVGPALRPPLLGMCEPRDIAAAVTFLISPAARYITNQTLTIDAGWSLS